MRKAVAGVTAVFAVGAAVAGASYGQAAPYAGPCQAVFVSPHQDDEVLSMGAAIRQHVEVLGGDKVCAVLFTTGLHSNTKNIMRAAASGSATYAGWIPSGRSGAVSHPGLTDAQFIAARDREFVNALVALGLPTSNVYVNGHTLNGTTYAKHTQNEVPGVQRVYDDNDGNSAQQARARTFMNAVIGYFGSGKDYKTQSPQDPSGDHAALGVALRDTALPVSSKRYYYPPYQRSLSGDAGITLYEQKASSTTALLDAARAYGTYDPATGSYGIGWLSVPQPFGGPALQVRFCQKAASGSATCGGPTAPYAPQDMVTDPAGVNTNVGFVGAHTSWVQLG